MKKLLTITLSAFIFLCMVIATERQAWGYVDPGSGLLALQSIASVLAAVAWFVRRRIRGLFSRSRHPNPPNPATKPNGAKTA